MAQNNNKDNRLEQSRRITTVGCIGVIVLLVLIYVIGLAGVKSDLGAKHARATEILARMQSHLDRTPGIFDRMLVFDCGDDAVRAVESYKQSVGTLKEKASFEELESLYRQLEQTWTEVSAGCAGEMDKEVFIGLKTELEGIQNRYNVEKGNFAKAAAIFNETLNQFPATIFNTGYKPL